MTDQAVIRCILTWVNPPDQHARVDYTPKAMAPSRSDKSRTTAGVGAVTSFLLSSQNPLHTPPMGLGHFLGFPSSSSSNSSSSRPRGGDRPPLGPGSSKFDYAYGLNPPGPSTSPGLAQSFFQDHNDAPPAYSPQNGPGFNDYATDIKMPMPETTHTGMSHFPTPVANNALVDSMGEASLQMLVGYDIVIILDDSYSMLSRDKSSEKTRWDQVSNRLLTPCVPAPHRGPE